MSLKLSMRKVHERLVAADITAERNFRIPVSKKKMLYFSFLNAPGRRDCLKKVNPRHYGK